MLEHGLFGHLRERGLEHGDVEVACCQEEGGGDDLLLLLFGRSSNISSLVEDDFGLVGLLLLLELEFCFRDDLGFDLLGVGLLLLLLLLRLGLLAFPLVTSVWLLVRIILLLSAYLHHFIHDDVVMAYVSVHLCFTERMISVENLHRNSSSFGRRLLLVPGD